MMDNLVNQCRFLPVSIQLYLFITLFALFHSHLFILAYFWWIVLGLELVILFILIQKNIVYRNVSVVEKAIKWKVFWIKTNSARKLINIYWLGGLTFLLITVVLHIFWYQTWSVQLIVIYLLGFLFLLKGIFYTPVVTIRYNEDEFYLTLVNEYKKTKLLIYNSEYSSMKILENGLLLLDVNGDEIKEIEINFLDDNNDISLDNIFSERVRLQRFLEGILSHKDISICYT